MYVQACACYFFDLKIIDIFSLAPLEKKNPNFTTDYRYLDLSLF